MNDIIVVIPTDYKNAKKIAIQINKRTYHDVESVENALMVLLDTGENDMIKSGFGIEKAKIYTLEDFLLAINEDTIRLDGYFVSQLSLELIIKKHNIMTKFKEGVKVVTTVKMTTEDVGQNIKVGTTGVVFAEPNDAEQLVGVTINGLLNYLPQDVLELKPMKKATGIKKVLHKMSIMTIPENALLDGVVKLLEGREAFTDITDMNERIYQGDIFEEIGGAIAEIMKLNPKSRILPSQKVIDQIDELAKLVDTDYLMITMS